MKNIFFLFLLFFSTLSFCQTTELVCYNCQEVPKVHCAPCATGLVGRQFASGISVNKGPSNKTFIKKPFTWFVSGSVFTLTDYTGKSVSFKASETVYSTVSNVLEVLADCSCPPSDGGGVNDPFELTGDSGSGEVGEQLNIRTGTVLNAVASGNTVTIGWDVAGVTANSVPYYNGTTVAWRTFSTGIVDDPTVVGVDAASLQTVLNNLNSRITLGGGGGVLYTSANGLTLNDTIFELGGTLNRATSIASANNSFKIERGTYNFLDGSTSSSILGFSTGIGGSGNGILLGDNNSATAESIALSLSAPNGLSIRHEDDTNGTSTEFIFKDGHGELESRSSGTDNLAYLHTDAPTNSISAAVTLNASGFGGVNQIIMSATDIRLNGGLTQFSNHTSAWAALANKALYKLQNDPTLYQKDNSGAFGDFAKAPQAITKYTVNISGANSGSSLNVISYGAGITASFASNKLTVTIPSGVRILALNWRLVAADVQASADAGGTTNWVQVEFANSGLNTGFTDFNIPTLQKTAIPTSGALSVTNAATVDFDNNPAVSVIGISSGTLTLRIGGLAVGAQGYLLTFNNL